MQPTSGHDLASYEISSLHGDMKQIWYMHKLIDHIVT